MDSFERCTISNPICVACMLPSHIKNAFPLKDIDARDIHEHEKRKCDITSRNRNTKLYFCVFQSC